MKSLLVDPENPKTLAFDKDPDDASDSAMRFSLLELPDAPRQRWSTAKGASRWTERHQRLKSRHLRSTRSVWVYRPPEFDRRSATPNLLVVFDGVVYRSAVPTPTIVQNLVSAGKIGPTVVVLLGSARGARNAELAHNREFVDFLARELLPWLQRRYGVRTDASRTVVAGSSLGGLSAAFAGLRYPKKFGNVLAQSGTFHFSTAGFEGNPTLIDEFVKAPRLPLRFYLDAGSLERRSFPGQPVSLLGAVRHMRDVLRAKGYRVAYAEFEGGHDYACWAGTMADGLIALLGKRASGAHTSRRRPR